MSEPAENSRFVKRHLNDRQVKSFKAMYENLEYEARQIRERFGISDSIITQLAQELSCTMRKARRQ